MELPGYATLTTRARAATVAICTVMAVELCVIAADVYVLGVLGAPVPTVDDLNNADRALGLAGVAELVMWVVGGVFFIRWFARAYRNLDVLAPGLRTHTPGWAIWGWITPVMSLFRPKQIADQIARCRPSEDGAGALLGAWWGLFIGGSILSNGVGRLAFYADTSEQVKTATWLDLLASGVLIAAGVLALRVISSLTSGEEQLAERRLVERATGQPGPPLGRPVEPAVPRRY